MNQVGGFVQQPQADGHGYKDRNEDVPLTLQPQFLRAGANRLKLSSYDAQPHVAVLVLCETATPEAVFEAVRRERSLGEAKAFGHMRATFGDDDDDDLIAGPCKLSLTCPLMHTRLRVPARGSRCRHLECFDLLAYIECARSTSFPRWTCPLCNKPARPHQLAVDTWTAMVLDTSPQSRLGSSSPTAPLARCPTGPSAAAVAARR